MDRRRGLGLLAALTCSFAAGVAVQLTGNASAQSAPLEWSFPAEVAPSSAAPARIAFHVDSTGTAYAAWLGYRSSPDHPAVWIRSRRPASVWGQPEIVWAQDSGIITQLALTSDAAGLLHAVWSGSTGSDSDVFHTVRGASGGWSRPARVNDDSTGTAQDAPAIAPDLWGNVHVVWEDHRSGSADIFSARIGPGGRAGRNVLIHQATAGDQAEPAIALASSGDLHAVWTDTSGGTAVVANALVPHAGLGPDVADDEILWWPAATLSRSSDRQSSPILIPLTHGEMAAAWIDGGERIRATRLTSASPYWEEDRVLHEGSRTLGELSGAADLAGRAVIVWGEGDSSSSDRLVMSGTIDSDVRTVLAARADYSPITTQGARPAAAAIGTTSVMFAFLARGLDGRTAMFVREAPLPAAALPDAVYDGWLSYIPTRKSCPLDGYLITSCDGATGPFMSGDVDPRFIGRWVRVEGKLVEGVRCPQLLLSRVVLSQPPCPRSDGSVTGVVTVLGTPVAGAQVRLATLESTTGASGRFFLGGVPGGTHAITATAQCALGALGSVHVQNEFTTVAADAELTRADVQEDCIVDLWDLVRVTLSYHTAPPRHPRCSDLNSDGEVDVLDVAAVAGSIDDACPSEWSASVRTATDPQRPKNSLEEGAGAALVYRGHGAPVAWALRLVRDTGSTFGAEPFVTDASLWVIENRGALHEAVLAAATVAGPLRDGDTVAWLRTQDAVGLHVEDVVLAGAGGTIEEGAIEIARVGADTCPRCAYLPALGQRRGYVIQPPAAR